VSDRKLENGGWNQWAEDTSRALADISASLTELDEKREKHGIRLSLLETRGIPGENRVCVIHREAMVRLQNDLKLVKVLTAVVTGIGTLVILALKFGGGQ